MRAQCHVRCATRAASRSLPGALHYHHCAPASYPWGRTEPACCRQGPGPLQAWSTAEAELACCSRAPEAKAPRAVPSPPTRGSPCLPYPACPAFSPLIPPHPFRPCLPDRLAPHLQQATTPRSSRLPRPARARCRRRAPPRSSSARRRTWSSCWRRRAPRAERSRPRPQRPLPQPPTSRRWEQGRAGRGGLRLMMWQGRLRPGAGQAQVWAGGWPREPAAAAAAAASEARGPRQ